jgi:hypothetical protein
MGNRYYPINGKELASVTTITGLADKSAALVPWAAGLAVDFCFDNADCGNLLVTREEAKSRWRTIRDEAGHIGTMVHDALEEYLHGIHDLSSLLISERTHPNPVVANCAEIATKLIAAATFKLGELGEYKVLATERKVVNEDEWYAGRFDVLLEVDGEVWLIDFKTGASFYPEWGMQLAAYAEAWEDEQRMKLYVADNDSPRFIDRIKVLRLDKKTLKAYWKEYGGEKDKLTRENYWQAFLGLRDAFYILKARKSAKLPFLESR